MRMFVSRITADFPDRLFDNFKWGRQSAAYDWRNAANISVTQKVKRQIRTRREQRFTGRRRADGRNEPPINKLLRPLTAEPVSMMNHLNEHSSASSVPRTAPN